jgi:hypothetical protein
MISTAASCTILIITQKGNLKKSLFENNYCTLPKIPICIGRLGAAIKKPVKRMNIPNMKFPQNFP